MNQSTFQFNLVTDRWIPVVKSDGSTASVGLQHLFDQMDKIRDLSVMPHERIALYRLLICITQAALDGPKDRYAWKESSGSIQESVIEYLAKWKEAFNLFGDGPRFLQVNSPRFDREKPASLYKLEFVDADGTTLFDQHVDENLSCKVEKIPFLLLSFQNFVSGGTVEGKRKIGTLTFNTSATSGVCRDQSAFHSFLLGDNLLETIWLNLINKESLQQYSNLEWDRPVWEIKAKHIDDFKELNPSGYLSRLVPYSRSVWILDLKKACITAGVDYHNFESGVYEASTCCRLNDEDNPFLVSAERQKNIIQPWRMLHALLMQRSAQKLGGPLALGNLEEDQDSTLWVGALGAYQAKVIDLVESLAPIPSALRKEEVGLRCYEAGIKLAEAWQKGLSDSISIWAENISADYQGDYKKNKEKRAKLAVNPTIVFWSILESRLADLINECAASSVLNQEGFKNTLWGQACRHAATEAYEKACPHETPRQMKAYAEGLKQLHPKYFNPSKPKKSKAKK